MYNLCIQYVRVCVWMDVIGVRCWLKINKKTTGILNAAGLFIHKVEMTLSRFTVAALLIRHD